MKFTYGFAALCLLATCSLFFGAVHSAEASDTGSGRMSLLPGDEECRLLEYAERYGNERARISSSILRLASADSEAPLFVADSSSSNEKPSWAREDEDMSEDSTNAVSDPLEPLNRAFFTFNDKLYFWVIKPVSQGYKTVVPETARVGVRNFFKNLTFPIRFINCLLQGKGEEAGYEFVSFFMNSTVGLGGFVNVSGSGMGLESYNEDLGQTLGSYGMGPSVFINWPILGPSCVRDTLGLVGDSFLDPVNYIVPRTKYNISVKTYNRINETSLTIGDYEDLKKSALDPYVSLRDAYFQHRKQKIEE